jgi:hypothetical protein
MVVRAHRKCRVCGPQGSGERLDWGLSFIMTLPLTPEEKAEVVRRVAAGEDEVRMTPPPPASGQAAINVYWNR